MAPLTTLLDQRRSPVREFFEEHLPNLRPAGDRCRDLGPPTILPIVRTGLGTVGTAFDYRVRYLFEPFELATTNAGRGAMLLHGPNDSGRGPFDALGVLDELAGEVRFIDPVGNDLSEAAESRLCRCCYVLALFEERFRMGPRYRGPMDEVGESDRVDELLAIPSDETVGDLCALSRASKVFFVPLTFGDVVLNPTFAGSKDIRADADLIVDHCLIELKVSVEKRPKREWLYQLVGYVLLDYDDEYGIDAVGLYLGRVPVLVTWPFDELLTQMAGVAVDRRELRRLFRSVVQTKAGRAGPTITQRGGRR